MWSQRTFLPSFYIIFLCVLTINYDILTEIKMAFEFMERQELKGF